MSQAEELLDSMYALNSTDVLSANASTEAHIVVGSDRYIIVPPELKRIAVQYDHDVETVTFDCPRYWDDRDMSMMNIYINYLRSDGEVGTFKATNVVVDDVDDTIMHFDWTLSRNATKSKGDLVFLVCVKSIDSDGVEKAHWNSELCRDCRVSEGLEMNGEDVEELYIDVIEQWGKDIENLESNLINLRDNGTFDGATFTPSVDEASNLSWTNNKGKPNPATKNIRGLPGVSPTITTEAITRGYRLTITDVNGTKSIDIKDATVDSTTAVSALLDTLFEIGTEEPSTGPCIWFDTTGY